MVSTEGLNKKLPIGILTGPTATGKTALGIEFAKKYGNIEIINADSLLVYRGMNIGTAKPTPEECQGIPHHLIDIVSPDQPFTAGEFCRAVQKALDDIENRGHRALILGGTGFYLKALLFGMWSTPAASPEIRNKLETASNLELFSRLTQIDPTSAQRIGESDRYRLVRALEIFELTGKSPTELQNEAPTQPDPRYHLWILDRSNDELTERIHLRTDQMIQQGLIEEYQTLVQEYPESRALSAVGYSQVADYLQGKLPPGRKLKPGLIGLSEEIQLATRQLVKSQRTWFRNQSQKVPTAQWFELEQDRFQLEEAFKSVYVSPEKES